MSAVNLSYVTQDICSNAPLTILRGLDESAPYKTKRDGSNPTFCTSQRGLLPSPLSLLTGCAALRQGRPSPRPTPRASGRPLFGTRLSPRRLFPPDSPSRPPGAFMTVPRLCAPVAARGPFRSPLGPRGSCLGEAEGGAAGGGEGRCVGIAGGCGGGHGGRGS